MTPQNLAHAIEATERCLEFTHPADGQLSAFFRHYPKLGGRERAFVAETVYGVLRHLRSLEYLATTPAAPRATPRRLVLAWLARFGGHNLREFEALASRHELDWLRDLKGVALSAGEEIVASGPSARRPEYRDETSASAGRHAVAVPSVARDAAQRHTYQIDRRGASTAQHRNRGAQQVYSLALSAAPPAVQLDLPDWLHERLLAQYGDALPALMSALNAPAPLDLRVNPARLTRDQALAALRGEASLVVEPTPWSPLGLRIQGRPALHRHPLFLDGSLEVQDEGSQLLGLLLAPRRGERVCDFCAGAGGKTLLLGALMRGSGRLYAFDVAEHRLAKMRPRLARAGLSNVQAQVIADARDPRLKRLAGKFDRVLVDAPCSGLGTLRRNPDLKWRQTPQTLLELADKQAAILAAASRLVRPGGRLVYATCSLLHEENEAVVGAFLARQPGFALHPAGAVLAEQRIALEMGDYLRLDPQRHATDGFFAAVLTRQEGTP